jgi:hypothetical protein
MSNLLPPSEKRLLHREYRLRVGITSLFFLTVFGAVGAVSLVPSLVRVRSLMAIEERSRDLAEQTLSQLGADEVKGALREADTALTALAPLLAEPKLASLIAIAVAARPVGVSIRTIAYDPGKGGAGGRLMIGGKALLRDDLLAFLESLRGEAVFASVELPIGDLARERDATFNIGATLSEEP